MGKLKGFEIRLASQKTVYKPGDVVAGDLLVRLESPMETRGIKMKFNGEANVNWSERQRRGTGKNARTVTVYYRGKERLFNHKVYVFGEETGDERKSLSQGEHVYPFSYQLPSRLPTSYEDHVGHIRYEIRATIDKPWKIDRTTRKVFTVLDTVDLNKLDNATVPTKGGETKHLCCWCCKSGPIQAEFQSDRSAYVPGEFVTINASLKNKSNSKVKATSASLMQRVTYHATRKSKSRLVSVATVEGKECPKGKTITWTNERIQIPPVPPTMKGTCSVLQIEYCLMIWTFLRCKFNQPANVQFQGHLRMCAVDLREFEEITIGTVPLKSLDRYRNMGVEQKAVLPSAPEIQSILPSTVPQDTKTSQMTPAPFSAPPRPIYKDSMGGAINLAAEGDDGRTLGDASFTPQYTFYDWSQSAFTY